MSWKKDLKKDQVFIFKGSTVTQKTNMQVQAKNVNAPRKPLGQQNYKTDIPSNRPITRSRTNQTLTSATLKEKPMVQNADDLLISKVKNMNVRDVEKRITRLKKENLPSDNQKNPLQKV